jgi:hypothetical protein
MQFFRISALMVGTAVSFIAFGTFSSSFGFRKDNPMELFIIYFIINVAMLAIYVILQIVLVLNTLDDLWPLGKPRFFHSLLFVFLTCLSLGDLFFGVLFFILGQIFIWVLSIPICDQVKHYIDGLFLGTMFTLLSVMMVYKYWDSITKEDLEFSVGGRMNVWEVREPLLDDRKNPEFSAKPNKEDL